MIRIAILGLYRSGSSALAGVLHHLGVEMGAPFFGDYFESAEISEHLRHWWNEPHLTESVSFEERVATFRRWASERETKAVPAIGLKHPLLTLCGDDLISAWGENVHFIWTSRSLQRSIQSLVRKDWWPNAEDVQRKLWRVLTRFVARQPHLRVDFEHLMTDPSRQIQRVVEYLRLDPDPEQVASAVHMIRPTSRQ